MTLYVDSSAFLKRYVDEPDSELAEELLLADPNWVTAAHTEVEVRRNLARLLRGPALAEARQHFEQDWARTTVIALDPSTCRRAVEMSETTLSRSLDALHLAAAERVLAAPNGLRVITFDLRFSAAARGLGLAVVP